MRDGCANMKANNGATFSRRKRISRFWTSVVGQLYEKEEGEGSLYFAARSNIANDEKREMSEDIFYVTEGQSKKPTIWDWQISG